MEMTIDNHIEALKSYHNGFTGYAGNLQDSIDVAIDTMCKYQKIQEILDDCDLEAWQVLERLKRIRKVVEDGKID